ncbi:MAG: hypothetical protein Q8O82_04885 [Pseudorhodobacter sp.]|nr:hypothetical protein [Pseudorhodobacter sp.]
MMLINASGGAAADYGVDRLVPMEAEMQTNALPRYDQSVNTTGCCAKFNPEGWDGQQLHFRDKPFVRATTRSFLHMPLNMGRVFARVQANLLAAKAVEPESSIVLSRDLSPWKSEHFFAVERSVPNEKLTTLSGDFVTKVFEGPYARVRDWYGEMQRLVHGTETDPATVYFFYTTCPKCAKAYGKNYVVGVAALKTEPGGSAVAAPAA